MKLKDAQKLYDRAQTYWHDNYKAGKEDLRFLMGEGHWSDEDIAARKDAGRPCHVIPVLPKYVHQVANDMRQNTPSINVLPVGEGSDKDTARIIKGLIRNIEYESMADEVYDTAGENAVRCGIGWIRVDHDYEDDESFNQKLYIRRVQNPHSVYLDPSSVECDGSDAKWAFVIDEMTKEDFEAAYPKEKAASFDSMENESAEEDTIRIAELFILETKESTKKQDKDGTVSDFLDGDDTKKTRTRKVRKIVVKRYKFSGAALLEETTFPGKYIPLIPVYGEEIWIDGKRHILSLIRNAKDAQRRINHWASKESEILMIAPIAPTMAAEGQIDDWIDDWQNPTNSQALRYKQTDLDGNPAPPPQRLNPPTIPAGIINAMEGAKNDIKDTLGLYDAAIGARSNETSGIAIAQRKQEGDVATFHFGDNRNRSITHVGRVLLNAIPTIYDTAQVIRIIGEEDEPEMVAINGQPPVENQEQAFDLTQGKYDVRVVTGPSYTTKRQESAFFMSEAAKANPALWQAAGDLIVKYQDIAGAEALANRLRKTIPPQLLEGEDGSQEFDPEKAQMMQVIQQMQQQMEGMKQEFAQAEVQTKQQEQANKGQELELKGAELQMKMQVEQQKAMNEAKKLELEERKIALEEWQAANPPPVEAPQQSMPTGIKLDTTGFQWAKTPEAEAAEAAEAERERIALEAKAAEEAQEKAIERAEREAFLNVLNNIAQGVGALVQAVNAPVQVVRDSNGQIAGATHTIN